MMEICEQESSRNPPAEQEMVSSAFTTHTEPAEAEKHLKTSDLFLIDN